MMFDYQAVPVMQEDRTGRGDADGRGRGGCPKKEEGQGARG
jgi:hypothetical protein